MNSTKIEQMPCAFEPNLIVTPDIWALSLVQKAPGQGVLGSEHANLILQLLRNDKIEVIKLHVMGYKPSELKERLKTNPCAVLTSIYVHAEIVTNEDREVAIIDEDSLHSAVKAVLGVKPKEYAVKNLQVHFTNATWLIPREKGLELIDKVQKQVIEFEKTKPTFFIAGKDSYVQKAWHATKGSSIMFGCMMTMSFAGKYLINTGVVALAGIFGAPALVPLSVAAAPTIIALGTVFFISKVYSPASTDGSYHSCYTWARERALELEVPEITNDVRLKSLTSDYIASVTSVHMSLAHNNINQGNERS
jgi:hypothetical protein